MSTFSQTNFYQKKGNCICHLRVENGDVERSFSLEWFSVKVLFIFVNFLSGLYLESELRIVHEL